MIRWTLTLLLASGLGGCGGDDTTPASDAGGADSSTGIDAASSDAAGLDASTPDPDARVVDCPAGGLTPGNTTIDLEHDGLTRTYRVHVPDAYDGTTPLPVVFNFHGFLSNATQQIGLTSMNDKADAEGFIAVHPEGTGVAQSWNAGLCCGSAMDTGVDDVGFVRAMLDDLAAQVCVDRSRVYATGMSNGGFLSHRLACDASDIIAAIAPVAGVMGVPMDSCTPTRPMPVMHFHGTADLIVPYDGGGVTAFPSVADTIAGWQARNGCTDTAESTYDMGDSHCETFDQCDGGVEVTLCTVEGGGHLWPGGFGSTSAIDATDHMWDFLSRYRL